MPTQELTKSEQKIQHNLTHPQALQAAIDAGLTHCNSIYGYRARRLRNALAEIHDIIESGDGFAIQSQLVSIWNIEFYDDRAFIWNDCGSEERDCWRVE